MTVTVLRHFGGIFRRCFKMNQPLQNHVVFPEKKGYFKSIFNLLQVINVLSEKQLVTRALPLKGHLCTLYSPKVYIIPKSSNMYPKNVYG